MAPRSNPTETEQRLAQLEQDMSVLARLLLDHQGSKPALVRIIERHTPPAGLETRPHHADELREAVA